MFDFPASPTDGQVYSPAGGPSYQYTGGRWLALNALATPGQIAFPATQNPSSDANTLDDYEEGVWTPGVTFGGAAVGMTFSVQSGRYTKIGRGVSFTGYVVLSAKGSSAGVALITGLPFAADNQTIFAVTCRFNTMASGITAPVVAFITQGGTTINPGKVATGVVTQLSDTDFTATSSLQITGQYNV